MTHIEAMKQALEAYCKTLHPLWNTGISRAEAEGFFNAGFKAAEALAKQEQGEPVATPPANCRQRLKAEGKIYGRSNCQVCGSMAPKWKECDTSLTNPQPAQPKAEQFTYVGFRVIDDSGIPVAVYTFNGETK